MAVSVLDAALTFVADKTQTDAAFDELPRKAEQSFGQASVFVQKFKDDLDGTAQTVNFAGEKVLTLGQAFRTLAVTGPEHLKDQLDNARAAFAKLQDAGVDAKGTILQATIKVTEREIAYHKALGDSTVDLQKQLATLKAQYDNLGGSVAKTGTEGAEAGKKTGAAFHEARGSVDLLSDAIGIHIPRELKSLISTLPGVSSALSSAFVPVAVVALVGLLVEAGQKILEFREKQRIIALGWEEYRVTVDDTSRGVIEQIQAQEKQIIELTQGPLAALEFGFSKLRTTAFETFKGISSDLDLVKRQIELSGTGEVFHPFGTEAVHDLDAFKVSLAQAMRAAELAHPENQQAVYAAALSLTVTKIQEVTEKIERMQRAGADAPGLIDPLKAQLVLLNDINTALNQGVELDQVRAKLAQQTITNTAADDAAKQVKRNLDEQIVSIEAWKVGVHSAFVSGATDAASWAAAQVQAAALAKVATEESLASIIAGYHRAGESQKENIAIQELATLQMKNTTAAQEAMTAAQEKSFHTIFETIHAWDLLVEQNVAKTWQEATKAAEDLVRAENRLHEAQTNLSLANTSADFSRRIQQVEELATVGIISEQQKAERLREIYISEGQDQQENLATLARQQEDAINVAQAKLDQAKDNPFFTDAQLADLQKNLDQALTQYTDTQAKIVATQERSDNQIASLDNQILRRAISSWNGYFEAIIRGSLTAGSAVRALGILTAQGIGASVAAAVGGSSSFGEAMAQMAKSALASLAGIAVVHVIEEIASAFSDLAKAASAAANPFTAALAPGYIAAAHAHFAAAGKWGLVGAGAALGGSLIPSGGDKGQPGAPGNLPPVQQTPATTAQQNPTQLLNIPRFAGGALISKRTIAELGDSGTGGNAVEGVLPLDDDRAMARVADAIVERMSGGGAGSIHNVFNIKGGVVDTKGLMKLQTRAARRGQGRLTSTDSLRLTRRG